MGDWDVPRTRPSSQNVASMALLPGEKGRTTAASPVETRREPGGTIPTAARRARRTWRRLPSPPGPLSHKGERGRQKGKAGRASEVFLCCLSVLAPPLPFVGEGAG